VLKEEMAKRKGGISEEKKEYKIRFF